MIEFASANFCALGTGCTMIVTDARSLGVAYLAAITEIAAVDRSCSRFRDDSELNVLHRDGGRTAMASTDLVGAIEIALRAAELTDGDLDPTIGPVLVVLGYDTTFANVQRDGDSVGVVRCARSWRSVRVDAAHRAVEIPEGVTLDLGATAKAWAADRAATAAATAMAPGRGVLVSLGGDIATAGEAPLEGWQVHIADSHAANVERDGSQTTVVIHDGAIATSSTTARRWARGGVALHHIVDPATSLPAREVWRTVSVAAATCVDANIAATTAIIRGERAAEWFANNGLPARLVRGDGSITTVNGWPSEEHS